MPPAAWCRRCSVASPHLGGLRVLTLNTRPTNAAAIALYEGLGYRRWKEEQRPWGLAVFLRKTLDGERTEGSRATR